MYLEFFQTNEKEGQQRNWISFSHSQQFEIRG